MIKSIAPTALLDTRRAIMREPTSLACFLKEDYLTPLGMDAKMLASSSSISFQTLCALLEEDAAIDEETDTLLAKYFKTNQGFFSSINRNHKAWKEKHRV